jgi:hypothetical protein
MYAVVTIDDGNFLFPCCMRHPASKHIRHDPDNCFAGKKS